MKTSSASLFHPGDVVTALCRRQRMTVARVRKRVGVVLCEWFDGDVRRQQWFLHWQLAAPLPRREAR